MAILAIAVWAERIAKEVEGLAAGIPNRGLRLVEGEPKLGHPVTRPRQRLFRRTAAEDNEVVGIGDDPGLVGLAPSRRTPMLQEPVHVQVGEQWAYHPTLRRAAGTALAPGQAPLPGVIALLDRRFEPQLDQPQHVPVDDPPCHRPHQVLMRNRVEGRGDTLPISARFRTGGPSCVKVTPSKAWPWRSWGRCIAT